MKYLTYIIAILIIISASCKKDSNQNSNSGNTNTQTAQLDSFPLKVGNAWKYYTAIHVDSSGVDTYDAYYNNYWKVLSDTTITGTISAKISQLDSNYTGTTQLRYGYYANKSDGFYEMAEVNGSMLLFLRTTQSYYNNAIPLFTSFGDNSLRTDTAFVPDTPLYLMKFPAVNNDSWHSNEFGATAHIVRKWINDTTITTSAGIFTCKKLEMFQDNKNDGQPDSTSILVYEYISTKGLIEEIIYSNATDNYGNIIGKIEETATLVQINF